MKKTILAVILVLASQFSAQEAQAIENEEFWVCAVAVAGVDLLLGPDADVGKRSRDHK